MDDDELDEDPDAPRVVGKPSHKADGRTFYTRLIKGEEELRVGQDVCLDTSETGDLVSCTLCDWPCAAPATLGLLVRPRTAITHV